MWVGPFSPAFAVAYECVCLKGAPLGGRVLDMNMPVLECVCVYLRY